MSCPFDLEHYAEILDAAKAGGYSFGRFGEGSLQGKVLLRHDVDLSLPAAIAMAELEAERGAQATYFLMTESVFYNLASPEGVETIARLRELGHAVGLHAVYPRVAIDERFDRVISWHNPQPEYLTEPVPGVVSAYSEPYFSPETYRSDSNQHWRSGCPHEELREGAFAWLQLLTHPEIWVYPGDTMGETMRAMVAAEAERRLEQLRADNVELD